MAPKQASDASGTGLFDAAARGWDAGEAGKLHLRACTPAHTCLPKLGPCLPSWVEPLIADGLYLPATHIDQPHAPLNTWLPACHASAERIRQLDERLASCLPPLIGAREASIRQTQPNRSLPHCMASVQRCFGWQAWEWRPEAPPACLQPFSALQHVVPPSCLTAAQTVGTLRPEVAAELGLPPEVVVAPGGGDNAMAALGSGAVREGTWVLSLGTSGGRLCCNNGDRQATSVLISFAGCGLPGQPTGVRNAWMWPHPEYFQRDINMMAVPTPSCAGTLFGPSTKAVLDPSGTICPFADAAGGWLPLLCTLNCTGVTEEVRLGLLRAQAVMGHHGLLCRGLFTHPVERHGAM